MGGLTYKGHPPPSRSCQLWGRGATHPSLIREEGDGNGARVFSEAHPDEIGQLALPIRSVAHPQKEP